MIDHNSQFMAILTAVGEAKQANADALGIPWAFAQMGVGDANGTDPVPDRMQVSLVNEQRRAPLNQVKIDQQNSNVIIAEQVIPENVGGWWIREVGLYDADGDLVAVANCAPSFKPLLAQGSGKTQVVRMNFIVTSAANVTLKVDPGVVLATRRYVDDAVETHRFRKNHLINGNFDIWQRGLSGQVGNLSGAAQSLYGPDRWLVYLPEYSTALWEQLTFRPGTGFNEGRSGLRVSRSGSSDGMNICQRIEGVETCSGKRVTVSFHMRSSINHICGVILRQSFGVGGSDAGAGVGTQVSVTTTFKKYVVTLDVPSTSGKTRAPAGDYLELVFGSLGKGAYSLDLASVQVERGIVATDFELRPLAYELMLCQRYYEKTFSQNIEPQNGSGIAGSLICIVYAGQSGSSSQPVGHWAFRVEKRSTPSIRLYSPMGSGPDGQWRSGSNMVSSENAQALIVGTRQASIDNSDVGIAPQTYYIHATADAEL